MVNKDLKSGKCPFKDWDELFLKSKTVDIEVVDTGEVRVKKSQIMNLKSDNAAGIKDKYVWLSVKVLIVNHPERGIYLLDAGLDSSFQQKDTGRVKGILKKFIVKGVQDPGQSLPDYLGNDIDRVKGILYTHLHYDHLAGTINLPPLDFYLSASNESVDHYPFLYSNKHYLDKVKVMTGINFGNKESISPFDGIIDVFSDQTIWAVSTPGHTMGSVSYLMKTEEGIFFFVGDSCIKEGIEKNIGPGTYAKDIGLAGKSMEKIKEFMMLYPDVNIVYSHDILSR